MLVNFLSELHVLNINSLQGKNGFICVCFTSGRVRISESQSRRGTLHASMSHAPKLMHGVGGSGGSGSSGCAAECEVAAVVTRGRFGREVEEE